MGEKIRVLVGDERGGLIQLSSDDNGRTWGTPEVAMSGIEACTFATDSNGTTYMGTRGDGLFRSHDGLRTWEQLDVPPGMKMIRSFWVDGDRLLLGTEPAGVYEYSGHGVARALGDIWSSPGSAEWFYPVKIEAVHIRGLSVDPTNPDRIYAAVQVGGVGISPDNGATWSDRRNLDLDVHQVRPHATRPGVVYAGSGGGGLYRSADYGETWACISEGCGQFVLDFAIDPRDPERMYLGTARGGVPS